MIIQNSIPNDLVHRNVFLSDELLKSTYSQDDLTSMYVFKAKSLEYHSTCPEEWNIWIIRWLSIPISLMKWSLPLVLSYLTMRFQVFSLYWASNLYKRLTEVLYCGGFTINEYSRMLVKTPSCRRQKPNSSQLKQMREIYSTLHGKVLKLF